MKIRFISGNTAASLGRCHDHSLTNGSCGYSELDDLASDSHASESVCVCAETITVAAGSSVGQRATMRCIICSRQASCSAYVLPLVSC